MTGSLKASPPRSLDPTLASLETTPKLLFEPAKMDPDAFAARFPGAPSDGELRRQSLQPGSTIGACLHELMSLNESMPAHTAREMIAIILVMSESPKAKEAEIIERARDLPYLRRVLAEGTTEEKEDMEHLLSDMVEVLNDATSTFDVEFPPDGYVELRAEPKLRTQKENTAVWHAWRDKVGAEMAEEEKVPEGEFRYDYNYENSNEDGRHGLFD
jgi:hypothetical protein